MSNVHIVEVEDSQGDLIDLEYYHHSCAPSYSGEWPAPFSVDSPVWCLGCGKPILEIPLTNEGVRTLIEFISGGEQELLPMLNLYR